MRCTTLSNSSNFSGIPFFNEYQLYRSHIAPFLTRPTFSVTSFADNGLSCQLGRLPTIQDTPTLSHQLYQHRIYSFCAVPGIAESQDGRFPTNSSASGFASSIASPSNVPALMILLVPYVSVSRQMVVPQSPQKNEVTVLPLLAVVLNSFGLPLVNEKPSPVTITLVENTEPLVLRQSRQKQRA